MDKVKLIVDIKSFWHPGSGEGGGFGTDNNARRDRHGLPFLPGRTLKGLLRDAVRRAEQFGWYRDIEIEGAVTETLFGKEVDKEGASRPGLLRFGNATLPEPLVTYLGQTQNSEVKSLRAGLYRVLFSSTIDSERGVAQKGALRSMEVVVPLALEAEISVLSDRWKDDSSIHTSWQHLVEQALPLVRAVGALRSRGLGRTVITLEDAV